MLKPNGYITLTSAIILSLVFMTITLAIGSYSFFSYSSVSITEYKKISTALAESCADIALLKFKLDDTYIGNEIVVIGNNSCSILPIETIGGQKIFKTQATINNTSAHFKAVLDYPANTLASWEEVTGF